MQFMVNGASLEIRYKVSSEAGWDFFRVYKDGTEVHADSGTTGGWETVTIALSGAHVIKLRYSKDSSGDGGTDDVRISRIRVT